MFGTSKLLIIGVMTVGLAACSNYNFAQTPMVDSQYIDEPISIPGFELTELNAKSFGYMTPAVSHNQVNNSQNKTTINFQVVNGSGDSINDLRSSDLTVIENGINVPGFSLSNNARQVKTTTDIVFMIDVTCSMGPSINSAKSAVINFIRNSRANGYHTRMCLSTFGDYTVRKCDRFYDNDPEKPSTETEVTELISEVTRLAAGCGAEDPGGRDLAENPLRAIMDAETAPYAQGSQRFGILLTDAAFLYAPGNAGALGAAAPVYADTLASLQRSKLNMFVAAPNLAGYSLTFNGQPSLVQASNGEFFPYPDLVAGRTTFTTILNRIIQRVQTTYTIEYTSDEIPGLDPSLPLTNRTIEIRPGNSTAPGTVVRIIGTDSSMPNGQQPLLKKFKVTDRAIAPGSVVVKINGTLVTAGYQLVNGEIIFNLAPVNGAKIDISYSYARLKDGVSVEPIVFDGREDLSYISVFLNGTKVDGASVKIEKNLEGNWLLTLNDSVFSDADVFGIRAKGFLRVRVFRTTPL